MFIIRLKLIRIQYFRQLAAIYEVLKDKSRREMYDRVRVVKVSMKIKLHIHQNQINIFENKKIEVK